MHPERSPVAVGEGVDRRQSVMEPGDDLPGVFSLHISLNLGVCVEQRVARGARHLEGCDADRGDASARRAGP